MFNNFLSTENDCSMYQWYIIVLRIDLEYFYEYKCLMKWNLALILYNLMWSTRFIIETPIYLFIPVECQSRRKSLFFVLFSDFDLHYLPE